MYSSLNVVLKNKEMEFCLPLVRQRAKRQWLQPTRTGSSMKTSGALAHACSLNRACQDATFVPPMSERMRRDRLDVGVQLSISVSAPTDAHLILANWLRHKICSFNRLAAGRVCRALCAALLRALCRTHRHWSQAFLWKLVSACTRTYYLAK